MTQLMVVMMLAQPLKAAFSFIWPPSGPQLDHLHQCQLSLPKLLLHQCQAATPTLHTSSLRGCPFSISPWRTPLRSGTPEWYGPGTLFCNSPRCPQTKVSRESPPAGLTLRRSKFQDAFPTIGHLGRLRPPTSFFQPRTGGRGTPPQGCL